jgi:hypothetical protein
MAIDASLAIVASSVPIITGALAFQWQQRVARRDGELRQRRAKRLEYLEEAYRAVAAIGPAGGIGNLTAEEKRGLERAFSDAYVYGDDRVAGALHDIVLWAHSDRGEAITWDPLLSALRSELRAIHSLPGDTRRETPWIQTNWRMGTDDPSDES